MNRIQLTRFIGEQFGADEEYPWQSHPNFAVFRHTSNRKWFAVIMDIPKNKLGLRGDKLVDVVNLKCDPLLVGSLREEKGFYPAYHMNKESWITALLDGSVDDDKLQWLVEASYALTDVKKKAKAGENK